MSDFLNQTIANLYSQAAGNLAEAEIRNDLAIPETIPKENSSIMNETEIEFLESGGNTDVILSRYIQLLNIAYQCPYTGGPAVERARAFIAMINDSMEYDDDIVCLQVGVYRDSPEILLSDSKLDEVEINPNPAQNRFEVRLESHHQGICHVSVRNTQDKPIYSNIFPCNERTFHVNSGSWPPGVYYISVMIDHSFTEIKKLVIVK